MRTRLALVVLCSAALAAPASAQLQLSGQVDLLAVGGEDPRGVNRNFRMDSPYSKIRLRIFAQHWVTERIGVFTELLYDVAATNPRVNGAYVVINQLFGQGDLLNARIGMAPSPVGNFALRSTYFNANPLIGVPLPWQYRTTLDGSGLARNADLMRRRTRNVIGLPMLYDACWNLQWELMGYRGPLEYSVGITPGSVSNPVMSPEEDGVQLVGRVGLEPISGLRLGVSGAYGGYLGGPNRDTLTTARSFPGDPADYKQSVVGLDAEWSYGKLRFLGEAFTSSFDAPLITEELELWAAYAEGRWDFLPEWHGAVRVGRMGFNEISTTNDDLGPKEAWEDDPLQIESAIAYRFAREVMLRAGWQHTRFLTGPDDPIDLFGLQLRAVF